MFHQRQKQFGSPRGRRMGRSRHLSKTYVEWEKKSVTLGSGPVIISTCLDRITVLCAINVIRCFMPEWIFCICWWDCRVGTWMGRCCECRVGSVRLRAARGGLRPSEPPSCAACVGAHPAIPAVPEVPITTWLGNQPPGSRVCPQPFLRKADKKTG